MSERRINDVVVGIVTLVAVVVITAATRAVVHGAVAILVLDAFWAVTWLLGRAR